MTKDIPVAERIVNYLNKYQGWVSGDLLEKKTIEAGHKASYGSRECRRLAEEGKIQSRLNRKGYVEYASLGIEPPKAPKLIEITNEHGQRVMVYE